MWFGNIAATVTADLSTPQTHLSNVSIPSSAWLLYSEPHLSMKMNWSTFQAHQLVHIHLRVIGWTSYFTFKLYSCMISIAVHSLYEYTEVYSYCTSVLSRHISLI